MRAFFFSFLGLLLGLVIGYYFLLYSPQTLVSLKRHFVPPTQKEIIEQKQIIGFLPYWLVAKARDDYSDSITTLTYFGLTIDIDGKIQYLVNEQEEDPGYHMLKSKKLQKMLQVAKEKNITLSLLIFSGDSDTIEQLVSNPVLHAKNLVDDVSPIMKKYGFTDLNLDIESTAAASPEARSNFTTFVREVKKEVNSQKLGTVTVEITGQDLIRPTLVSPKDMGKIADFVVIMAYDFHYPGSKVAGAVAPLGGAESYAEFDTKTVLNQAYKYIPKRKIILGIPSYGYSWETINQTPRSATVPGSGVTVSNERAESLLASCSTCSARFDTQAAEKYVIYQDATGTFHQLFYPDKVSSQKKVDIVFQTNLQGLAIWALGYEGKDMYEPLAQYKKDTIDITHL